MEEKDGNVLVKRIVYLLLAGFSLAFGITWKDTFCLGDIILNAVGLPAWSQGTTGLHYPAIPSLIGTLIFFYLFASTTKDHKKTMSNLIVWTVVVLAVLTKLI